MRRYIAPLVIVSLVLQLFLIPVSLAQTPTLPSSTLSVPETPTSSSSPMGDINHTYDSSGNLLSDGQRQITWDVEGKPVKIVISGQSSVVSFLYDSSGARIGKIVKDAQGKITSTTLYIGGNLERELNPEGSVKQETKYYPAGSSLAQRKVNQQTGENELIFIHKDHLSSSTFFTNNKGEKTNTLLTYYPYGKDREGWDLALNLEPSTLNSPPTNRQYTGQIKDEETNLYYYNARYYNPQTGMFISPDTVNDRLNRYAYAGNNPILFNDPTGHAYEQGAGGGGGVTTKPPDAGDELQYTVSGGGYQPPVIDATNVINTTFSSSDVYLWFNDTSSSWTWEWFWWGFSESAGSNVLPSAREVGLYGEMTGNPNIWTMSQPYNVEHATGRVTGDIATGLVGAGGFIAGGGGAVVGCVGSAMVGCPVIAPAAAVGMTYTGAVVAQSGASLAKDLPDLLYMARGSIKKNKGNDDEYNEYNGRLNKRESIHTTRSDEAHLKFLHRNLRKLEVEWARAKAKGDIDRMAEIEIRIQDTENTIEAFANRTNRGR